MKINRDLQFILVNNALVVIALIGAVFDLPAIYTTFFAISVALQLSFIKRLTAKESS